MRLTWPKIKKIWWCFNCNIPVLENICPRCRSPAKRVPLSDPGDARLAFERDYRFLSDAYIYEFGTSKGFNDIIGKSPLLLNKAPYYDEMKEVVADGVHIGRLYFEPLLRRWRFRLSRYTAENLYTSYPDVLEKVVVDKKNYVHGDIVRIDKDIEKYKQVVLLDREDNIVGLGYSRGRGKIMIHTWWGSGQKVEIVEARRKSDIMDVIEAHRDYIRILTSRAKKFLFIMYEKIRKPVVVSFSGGKDSLVALHLSLGLGFEPVILFNNTGIELPETVETVYKTVDKYGLELVEASANDKFWRSVYELGVPGRDYRWCCKVCKLAPLAITVKKMWSKGGLNVVGQRAFESIDRARSPRVWRLRWSPYLLNLSPINEWSQFEVWLYIFINKLEPNPLYFMGYERIGCFMCPASTMAELDLVSQTHRELWSRWLEILEFWAKKLELPREWIDYALWRWNAPARYRTMLSKRLGVVDRVDDWRRTFTKALNPFIESVSRGEGYAEVVLGEEIDVSILDNQATSINPFSYSVDYGKKVAEFRWGDTVIVVEGRRIKASFSKEEGIEKLIDILKLYYRWRLCTGCRSCETICPSGAAKLIHVGGRERPVIDKKRCIQCKFCVYNCPVAEVYVEHVVAPIVFGDPEAWRRSTREHHSEVLEKIANFVKMFIGVETETRKDFRRDFEDISSFFEMNT
jgi:phosphoadenosine phosphosulfate reductase